jgi:hypothetical protein
MIWTAALRVELGGRSAAGCRPLGAAYLGRLAAMEAR